jgi:hypothetical protein
VWKAEGGSEKFSRNSHEGQYSTLIQQLGNYYTLLAFNSPIKHDTQRRTNVLKTANITMLKASKNISNIIDNRIVINRSLTQTFRDPLKTRTAGPWCRNCYDLLPLIPGSQRATKNAAQESHLGNSEAGYKCRVIVPPPIKCCYKHHVLTSVGVTANP